MRRTDNEGALFWADRGVGYVVSGGSDRGRLTQIAQSGLRPDGEKRGVTPATLCRTRECNRVLLDFLAPELTWVITLSQF